jgi:phage baseplate assembly protein V
VTELRIGIVAEQDAAGCRVRVRFPDRDQLLSWWLSIVVAKTQDDKAYFLPDLGEQVICLMDAYDEDGVVLGAVYSTADVAPPGMSADKLNWSAKDGASFNYDRGAHALAISIPATGHISISANGANIEIDTVGNVSISALGQIKLGTGALKGVARLGDTVVCPAGTGTINSASAIVEAS